MVKKMKYSMFKDYFGLGNYLINLIKFRLSCHIFPIHQLRYIDILRHLRTCLSCNLNEVGDKFHYMFLCAHLLFTI